MDLTHPMFDDDNHFSRRRSYFVGVDLGQAHDPTAIAVCEREDIAIVQHESTGHSTHAGAFQYKSSANLHELPARPTGSATWNACRWA